MSDMILIDARKGMAVIPAGNDPEPKAIEIKNIKYYGEGPADDCPEESACWCEDKFAVMISGTF